MKIESAAGTIEAQFPLPSPVTAFAWNPAGDRLALGCWDKATYLWRAGAHGLERHVTTRDSETIRIAWHPEGRFAACLTKGGASLCLWDTDCAEDAVSASIFIPFDSPLDWAHEGNALVFADSTGARREIKVELPTGFRLFRLAVAEPQRENFCTLDLDAAQGRAVEVTDAGARLWDWRNGLSSIAIPKADNEWLGARFLSGDLQACGWNSGLRAVSVGVRNDPAPSPDRGNPHVGCVLMDAPANGRWLGLLENPRDRFLIIRPGERKPTAVLSQNSPFWITFNFDGSRAATSSYAERDVHLWQLPEGRLERTLPVENSAALALSPDGRALVTVLNRSTTIWDADAGRPLRSLDTPEPPRMAAWSHDGVWIGIQTRAATYLFRAADGRLLARLQDPTPRPGDIHAAIAFSKSSHLLAEQFDDGSLLLWDLDQIRQGLSGLGMDWD
jgi:WD40 repeat protein